MNKKLIIVGIDSGDLDLIERFLPHLPTFQQIMKNGVYGKLKTTIPPLTPCAWSSFMTGKNPGQHGIYDFAYLREDKKLGLFDSSQRKDDDIWQILSAQGYKCIVFNVPMTFPAYPINGQMITDFTTPTLESDFTYPDSLKGELLREFPNYRISEESKYSENAGDQREFLKDIFDLLDLRAKVFDWLLINNEWHIAMVVFGANDHINHWYRKYMDQEGSEYKDALLNGYKQTDEKIKHIMEKYPDANFMFMSDHGTGSYNKDVNLNQWLLENKYIFLNKSQGIIKSLLQKVGLSPSRLIKIALNLKLWKLIKKLGIKDTLVKHTSITFEDVDWTKTKAYSFGYYGPIYIVDDANREKLVAELKEKLLKIKALDGNPLISDIWTRDQLYHGRNASRMPDLIFAMQNFTYGCSSSFAFGGNQLYTDPKTFKNGDHSINGIFAAYGPDIKNTGDRLENIKITDIAPTVLKIFGADLPNDLDGRALNEIFK